MQVYTHRYDGTLYYLGPWPRYWQIFPRKVLPRYYAMLLYMPARSFYAPIRSNSGSKFWGGHAPRPPYKTASYGLSPPPPQTIIFIIKIFPLPLPNIIFMIKIFPPPQPKIIDRLLGTIIPTLSNQLVRVLPMCLMNVKCRFWKCCGCVGVCKTLHNEMHYASLVPRPPHIFCRLHYDGESLGTRLALCVRSSIIGLAMFI